MRVRGDNDRGSWPQWKELSRLRRFVEDLVARITWRRSSGRTSLRKKSQLFEHIHSYQQGPDDSRTNPGGQVATDPMCRTSSSLSTPHLVTSPPRSCLGCSPTVARRRRLRTGFRQHKKLRTHTLTLNNQRQIWTSPTIWSATKTTLKNNMIGFLNVFPRPVWNENESAFHWTSSLLPEFSETMPYKFFSHLSPRGSSL